MELENENAAIDYCPPPPCYYKRFAESTSALPPPDVGESCDQYADCITAPCVIFRPHNDQIDYKLELTKILDDLYRESLVILSKVPHHTSVDQLVERLTARIEDFTRLLGEYRKHEAREKMCDLKSQRLLQLEEFERSLERFTLNLL